VVAVSTDDSKETNVWIVDLSGATTPRQLTLGGANRYPVWSGDGERVAFQSDREGDFGIFWQMADGTGTAKRLTKAEQGIVHIRIHGLGTAKIFHTPPLRELNPHSGSIPLTTIKPRSSRRKRGR
jgi:Tol biopolymer transport system component